MVKSEFKNLVDSADSYRYSDPESQGGFTNVPFNYTHLKDFSKMTLTSGSVLEYKCIISVGFKGNKLQILSFK